MGRVSTLEKFHKHIFDDFDSEKLPDLTDKENEQLKRIRAAFTHWLEHPAKGDNNIVRFLMKNFKVSKRQAYYDIADVKNILGNVTNAGKEFQRYTATEMIKKGYERARTAESAFEVKQAQAMINAAKTLGYVHQLHIADEEQLPWDEIIPQTYEPSSDPTILGIEPIPNLDEKIKKLKAKYDDDNIDDIDFENVPEIGK